MKIKIFFSYYIVPLLSILFFAVLGFLLHKLFFQLINFKELSVFVYTIESLYVIFTILSIIIVLILLLVKKKNLDIVGYTFLILTSIKMVIAYMFLKPILEASNSKTEVEKINFFIIFCFFLAIETVVTIRMLNNKA